MAQWEFVVAETGDVMGEVSALTGLRGRKYTARLNDADEVSFSLDGRSDDATLIQELRTDIVVYRNDEKLARCRVGKTEDTIDADSHTLSVTGMDYREVLNTRIILPGDNTAATQMEQEAIGWSLINLTQSRPGGNLGITRGASQATGVLRDREAQEPGKSIGEALEQLASVTDGFEWEIDADLRYVVHYPLRGNQFPEFQMEYGGVVQSLSRVFDPRDYSNVVLLTGEVPDGAEEGTARPVSLVTLQDIAANPEGRWEMAQTADIAIQSNLDSRAQFLLGRMSTPQPAYQVQIDPGQWEGPSDAWLGDRVSLHVESGRLSVNRDDLRITEVSFTIGQDGDEQISMTIGYRPPNVFDIIRNQQSLIQILSRR